MPTQRHFHLSWSKLSSSHCGAGEMFWPQRLPSSFQLPGMWKHVIPEGGTVDSVLETWGIAPTAWSQDQLMAANQTFCRVSLRVGEQLEVFFGCESRLQYFGGTYWFYVLCCQSWSWHQSRQRDLHAHHTYAHSKVWVASCRRSHPMAVGLLNWGFLTFHLYSAVNDRPSEKRDLPRATFGSHQIQFHISYISFFWEEWHLQTKSPNHWCLFQITGKKRNTQSARSPAPLPSRRAFVARSMRWSPSIATAPSWASCGSPSRLGLSADDTFHIAHTHSKYHDIVYMNEICIY